MTAMRGSSLALRHACALLLLCGGASGALAAPALMGNTSAMGAGYTAHDAPLGAPTELRIDLRGQVPARCKLASPPVLAQKLDFNRTGDAEARFGLDCNTPFNLRVRSGDGGFASQDFYEGVARSIPYELSVDVDTDAGLNALGWCRSDQLVDDANGGDCTFGMGAGWSSGDNTAIDRTGMMRLRWKAPGVSEKPALGRYRDTIVIELTVRS
jgi:hypothetical protein